ncbi:MAG: hypothetical protein HKL99_14560 [Burkholderiales bacterium]|nr:hypothetical protein [Burkholderiales bacterium]
MDTDTEDFIEDPAERIRQRADATLTRRLQDPQRLSPGSLVRVLFSVIEKHLAAGLTLEDIATALQEDGFAVKKTHLVRHLGVLRAERGLEPLRRGAKAKIRPPAPPAADPVAASTPTAGAKKQGASAPPASAPARPTSLPEIPRGDLTHTERENIAIPWFAQRFGGRNPARVQVDEVSAVELDWLEKLWDVSAPINPKTGDPFAHKAFTPGGRPTYNRPFIPPKAIPLGDDGDFVEIDDDLRENLKRYGAGLAVSEDCRTDLHTVFADGHLSVPYPRRDVTGMLRGMMPDIRKNWEKVRASGGPAIGVG